MVGLTKALLLAAGVGALSLPIFSSGLRRDLTFIDWLWGHTRWGPYPLYVPRELAIPPTTGWRKPFATKPEELKEYITPNAPKVMEYASNLYNPDRDTFILNSWVWTSLNFDYKLEAQDYWIFPKEMLELYEEAEAKGKTATGDCEDFAFLLASLLLAKTDGIYANIGYLDSGLHAWVSVLRDGEEYILETTLDDKKVQQLLAVDPWVAADSLPEFRPVYKFDDKTVVRLTGT